MFKKLSVIQRLQIGLILGMAFLMMLASNSLHKKHYSEINHTVNSVYKDRVVVQYFIYQLNNIFHQKLLQVIQHEPATHDVAINKKVEKLLLDFGKTELTRDEALLLNELNEHFKTLKELEDKMTKDSTTANVIIEQGIFKTLHDIEDELDGLAKIQLDEGNEMTIFSRSSLNMITLLSNIEITFIVLIGIVIFVLIFYPLKTSEIVH